ncbi:MAG: DUF523 domain-containing protein [Candidatus Izemoplasmatales bacterium]|jgi:uncharacterized protein YbbK (DUF523 family)
MPIKEKMAVSSCLLGMMTAYDGKGRLDIDLIEKLKGRPLIPICPEVLGGLPIPRLPSEIQRGTAKVFNKNGFDVTEAFKQGAEAALAIIKREGVTIACLKDGSPSCGFTKIYDGTFSSRKIKGMGIACRLFVVNNISICK